MENGQLTDAKIRAVLKQAEGGTPASEPCREHGMSSASFYKWRAKFGGMDASLITEMKDMAEQNRRLKRMYAEMSMQNDILKEALGKKRCGRLADESLSMNVPFACQSADSHECSHAAGHQYRDCQPHLRN